MAPPSRKKLARSQQSSISIHSKTEIVINVYDLMPPGKLSSALWAIGTSLLHSGVVINGKEYAYGGHDRRGVTGVYWTTPETVPPGATFRCEILHGFTYIPLSQIDAIIRETSDEFHGPAYNIIRKNCNHFTSTLCQRLTDRPGPSWLNRAASIGVALPCIVPRDWIDPPDYDMAEGELLNDFDEDEDATESSRMLRHSYERPRLVDLSDVYSDDERPVHRDPGQGLSSAGKGKGPIRDTSGRLLPSAGQAPSIRR